ncbi:MAG: hypothetical protein M3430_20225 [Acidobacteriota bacterium]|nr:hypothetical protein [Acidobacteriota bacterium]
MLTHTATPRALSLAFDDLARTHTYAELAITTPERRRPVGHAAAEVGKG